MVNKDVYNNCSNAVVKKHECVRPNFEVAAYSAHNNTVYHQQFGHHLARVKDLSELNAKPEFLRRPCPNLLFRLIVNFVVIADVEILTIRN